MVAIDILIMYNPHYHYHYYYRYFQYDDELPIIGASGLDPAKPFVMVTASDGSTIKDLVETSNSIVTLGLGEDVPLQGIDYGDPTATFDIASGSEVELGPSSVDFDYVFTANVNSESALFASATTTLPPMSYTVDVADGKFKALGSFPSSATARQWLEVIPDDGSSTLMALAERNLFEIYNVSDLSMPEIIGVGEASAPFCPGFAFSHYATKGSHLYITGQEPT